VTEGCDRAHYERKNRLGAARLATIRRTQYRSGGRSLTSRPRTPKICRAMP